MAAQLASSNPRRVLFLLAFMTVAFLVYYSVTIGESWRTLPLEKIGLGEAKIQPGDGDPVVTDGAGQFNGSSPESIKGAQNFSPSFFKPGTVQPPGANYTKMIVVSRTKAENFSWIQEFFDNSETVKSTVYVVDDPSAPFHPPENKGHETMVYLTYMIDHYDTLSDVNIFMHAHRYGWHNNEILDVDSVEMVRRLSAERVQREGYMNLRCQWYPGCPDWMHPGAVKEDINKKEEVELAMAWSELFPSSPIPQVVGQPCCSQFALSRDRIRTLPKARYIELRDWLLRTPLRDSISGRIWEYVWHHVFTGRDVYCPLEHICTCDGYGVCFGGEEQYKAWWEKMWDKRHWEEELVQWRLKDDAVNKAAKSGKVDEAAELVVPEFGKDVEFEAKIKEIDAWLEAEKKKAIEAGENPMNRAKEAGREWNEGDGF